MVHRNLHIAFFFKSSKRYFIREWQIYCTLKSTAKAGNSAKRIRYNDTSVQPQSERDKQSVCCDAVAGNGSSPRYKEGGIPMVWHLPSSALLEQILRLWIWKSHLPYYCKYRTKKAFFWFPRRRRIYTTGLTKYFCGSIMWMYNSTEVWGT